MFPIRDKTRHPLSDATHHSRTPKQATLAKRKKTQMKFLGRGELAGRMRTKRRKYYRPRPCFEDDIGVERFKETAVRWRGMQREREREIALS